MDTYVLIGAGGTGSHFIGPALSYINAWQSNQNRPWEMLIVDGDNYEFGNLERQMFNPAFIGTNKAEALAQMYSHFPVRAVPKFVGREDLLLLIEEGTTVFIGVDNYSLRALVEERATELENVIVINAGNEKHDGSVQLWVREEGANKTPRLTYGHPEIVYTGEDDRSMLTCAQAAVLPGGEQLIIANMAAAQHMLTALWRVHNGSWKEGWTELQFDLQENYVHHINMRERREWSQ